MSVLCRSGLEFLIAISSVKGEIEVQKPARYSCKDSTVRGAFLSIAFFATVACGVLSDL